MLNIYRAIAIVCVLAIPSLAHAVTFWDDQMESQIPGQFYYAPYFPGTYTHDTSVKFSGSASTRLNYPPACQTVTTANQCGGEVSRAIPATADLYRRAYFRMSGSGPNITSDGLFHTAGAFTKMLRATSSGPPRTWWTMGCCGSKTISVTAENAPTIGSADQRYSSIALTDNRWYCLESHEKMNTPGVADGVMEAWVDGVKVLTATNVKYRQTGDNSLWTSVAIFRQIGEGNIWWDRYAAGNTRIQCIGSGGGDTTAPATPAGWTVN